MHKLHTERNITLESVSLSENKWHPLFAVQLLILQPLHFLWDKSEPTPPYTSKALQFFSPL